MKTLNTQLVLLPGLLIIFGACKKKVEDPVVSIASLSTAQAASITANSAIAGGTISDVGGAPVTGRGVCWSSTITDIEQNHYRIVQIGSQVWLAENLRTTHYRNGDPIPNVM